METEQVDFPTKKIESRCKICGGTMTLLCAVGYDELRDPSGLMALVAHDKCYDQRQERRSKEIKIDRLCQLLYQTNLRVTKNQSQEIKAIHGWISTAASDYCELLAKQRGITPIYDDSFLEKLLKEPRTSYDHMHRYRSGLPWKNPSPPATNQHNDP